MEIIVFFRKRTSLKIRLFRISLAIICAFFLYGIFISYAVDTIDTSFLPQSATTSGSNNSQVWFSTGSAWTGATYYVNKNNDSDTIGNYLRGYYYDTELGFFQLDWNTTNTGQNVRIVSSTDKCPSGYGYRFGGYAKSDTVGFIQFDHDAENFVYYCESDKKLHGWAYSDHTGFQSFEGIGFEIIALSQNTPSISSGTDPFFVNNTTKILMSLPAINTLSTQNGPATIQGKGLARKAWQEVFFYIVK